MYSTYYNTSYIEKVIQSFLTIIVQNSPRNPQKCHVLREDFADHQRYQVAGIVLYVRSQCHHLSGSLTNVY